MNYDPNEALKLKNQICFPLYAAARKIINAYQPYLKPLGITYTQYIVFMVLWEEDRLPVSEICDRLLLDSGTITPLLKKLESEGYVLRSRSASDERSVLISLTEKGRALKEKAAEVPLNMSSCVRLEPGEGQELYRLLYKILRRD